MVQTVENINRDEVTTYPEPQADRRRTRASEGLIRREMSEAEALYGELKRADA